MHQHGKRRDSWPTLLVCVCQRGMGNLDNQEHSYLIVRGEILGRVEKELSRKHLPMMFSLIKNGGDRRRPGNVVVLPCRLEIGVVSSMTPSALREITKGLGSGGNLVAKLKTKELTEGITRSGAYDMS